MTPETSSLPTTAERIPPPGDGAANGARVRAGERTADQLVESVRVAVDLRSEQLLSWRRQVHQHPELSWEEHRTTDLVVDERSVLVAASLLASSVFTSLGPQGLQ